MHHIVQNYCIHSENALIDVTWLSFVFGLVTRRSNKPCHLPLSVSAYLSPQVTAN